MCYYCDFDVLFGGAVRILPRTTLGSLIRTYIQTCRTCVRTRVRAFIHADVLLSGRADRQIDTQTHCAGRADR